MTISEMRTALKRRWYLSVLVLVLAIAAAYGIDKKEASLPKGEASVQILVDAPSSSLVNVNVAATNLEAQAGVLAQAMTSTAVLASIARYAGVPPAALTAQGPYSGPAESLDIPTSSEARSAQLVSITQAFHFSFLAQPNVPIITVNVMGPNPQSAGKLADAVLPGTDAWLNTIAAKDKLKAPNRIVLRQLGDAEAGVVNSSSAKELAAVGAIAVIIFGLFGVVQIDRRRRGRLGQLDDAFESVSPVTSEAEPTPVYARMSGGESQPHEEQRQRPYADGRHSGLMTSRRIVGMQTPRNVSGSTDSPSGR